MMIVVAVGVSVLPMLLLVHEAFGEVLEICLCVLCRTAVKGKNEL